MRSLWLNNKNEPFLEQSSELIEEKYLSLETNQLNNSKHAIGKILCFYKKYLILN